MKVEGGTQEWTLLNGKSDFNWDNFSIHVFEKNIDEILLTKDHLWKLEIWEKYIPWDLIKSSSMILPWIVVDI